MTDQNSFVSDQNNEANKGVDTSFQQQDDKQEVDKKSIEGQLTILQKRMDDQLEFIGTLKGENKVLRDEKEASSKIDDLLSKLDASQIEDTGHNQQTSPMNIDDLKSQGFLTKQDLEEQKLDSIYADNFAEVQSAMIETYGEDKYLDIILSKSKELGMSVQDIDSLARSNPAAAIKLMEATKVNDTSSSTQGSFNTQAIDTYNSQQPASTPKSVMFGATTQDMTNAWRAAGDTVKKQMEQGNQFG